MKHLVILGAGTAGTMMANHLSHELKRRTGRSVSLMKKKNIIINPAIFFCPLIFTPRTTS